MAQKMKARQKDAEARDEKERIELANKLESAGLGGESSSKPASVSKENSFDPTSAEKIVTDNESATVPVLETVDEKTKVLDGSGKTSL